MAFWGVEVKPGRRFTHKYDSCKGRLHISMATLGFGSAKAKSTLQCNIGNRTPLCLCTIYPGNTESLQLNLEFDEADDVILTVIGPRSIHLSGYYLRRGASHIADSEETYGEDIADTETERSNDSDEYGGSFIDDDDVVPECEKASDDKRMKGSKGRFQRLRKKYQSVESDDDGDFKDNIIVSDSMDANQTKEIDDDGDFKDNIIVDDIMDANQTKEIDDDDDGLPISSMYKKKVRQKIFTKLENTVEDKTKIDQIIPDPTENEQNRKHADDKETATISSEIGHENDEQNGPSIKLDNIVLDGPKMDKIPQDLLTENEQNNANDKEVVNMGNILHSSEFRHEQVEKPKNKSKEQSREGLVLIANGAHDSNLVHLPQRNEHSRQPTVDEVTSDNFASHAAEKDSEKSRTKRRKKEKVNKGSHFEGDIGCQQDVVEEYKAKRDKRDSNNQEQHQKLNNEMSVDCGGHDFPDGNQNEGKVKKRKKKSRSKGNIEVNSELPLSVEQSSGMQKEDKNKRANANHSQVRTMSNGLVIEEIEMGGKDGKIAASGKKISVHYTGKLKEGGEVFESNVGQAPLKFRLGKGEVIEAWDVGLEGMRVGEKRRLLVPPSMASENEEYGGKIPPNSWLVYDIELVKVR